MPDTCRAQILAAVAAALAAALADATVERERRSPVTDGELPRVLVYDAGQAEASDFTGERGWSLRVSIECLALAPADRAASDAERDAAAQKAAGNLAGRALTALLADVTLGGLARDLRVSAEDLPALADLGPTDAALLQLPVEVEYATKETDLFSFA